MHQEGDQAEGCGGLQQQHSSPLQENSLDAHFGRKMLSDLVQHDGDKDDELDAGLRRGGSGSQSNAVSWGPNTGHRGLRKVALTAAVRPECVPPAAWTTRPRVVVILEDAALADSGSKAEERL